MTELELGHSHGDYGPAQFILGLQYFRAQRKSDGATQYFERTSPRDSSRDDDKLRNLAETLATGGRIAKSL
jgi:hypothetical protein